VTLNTLPAKSSGLRNSAPTAAAAGRRPQEPAVVAVRLSSLQVGESPRLDGHDPAHVARLAGIDGPFAPILVDRATGQVIDGTHRMLAAKARGQKTIDAEFHDGNPADLFLLAVRANVTQYPDSIAQPLSQRDRRAAAARIILSHPELSNRAIAEVAGLGARVVAAIRRCSDEAPPQSAARVGRDGRVRPLSTVDGRLRAARLIAEDPQASLREVARAAGVSPATAADVRKRLERGEDPVPAGLARTSTIARVNRLAPASLLDKVLRDPSLRHTEDGRRLLRLLRHCAIGPQEWADLVAVVPPRSAVLMEQLAKHYAQMWLGLARELHERAR
jgi:hypothetical protein